MTDKYYYKFVIEKSSEAIKSLRNAIYDHACAGGVIQEADYSCRQIEALSYAMGEMIKINEDATDKFKALINED